MHFKRNALLNFHFSPHDSLKPVFEYDPPIEFPSILAYNLKIRPFINTIAPKTRSPDLVVFKKASVPRFRRLINNILIKEVSGEGRKNKFCCPLSTKSSPSIKKKFIQTDKKFSQLSLLYSKKIKTHQKENDPYGLLNYKSNCFYNRYLSVERINNTNDKIP